MADADARWQTLDGEGRVVHNLVYNPTSGNWELEQQAVIEAVTSNIYVQLDAMEQLQTDTLQDYFLDDFDTSNDPTFYLGFQTKGGAYYIARYNTSTGAVDYTAGSSGYSTAWTNRTSESYSDFASTF
jgi:hypothetical protein